MGPPHEYAPPCFGTLYIYIYIAYKQQNTTQKTNTNQIHHTTRQATTPTSMAHIYLITGIETTVSLYIDIAPIGARGGWRADPPPSPHTPTHKYFPNNLKYRPIGIFRYLAYVFVITVFVPPPPPMFFRACYSPVI